MWVMFGARAAFAWCSSTASLGTYDPGFALVWPEWDEAPTDTILVLRRVGEGGQDELVLRAPDESEVPTTRYDLTSDGVQWAVLVPLAPLAPGVGYQVEGSLSPPFEVGADPAEIGAPPVPMTRGIESEVTWQDPNCPEEAVASSSVRYRLCEPPALTLITLGDSEPAVPTLSDVGGALLSGPQGAGLSDGLSADLSTTIWLGGFDAAGRFTGWTADPLQMPPAGTISFERAEGADGGPGSTPTSFSSCPETVSWTLESSGICEVWSQDTRECLVAPEGDEGDEGCGCDTGMPPLAGGLAALLIAAAGRRRPSGRPWRSPARA
jgi:hypothetical protein